jgi:hypothetical protein
LIVNPKEVREWLFNLYAANLSIHRPEYHDVFVCPLCEGVFDRSSLDDKENGPTVEHCIPGALRGKFLTLTCKQCNNTGGTNLDAHLVRRLEADDFLSGLGESLMDANLTIEGHRVRGSVLIRGGGKPSIETHVIHKATNPAKLKAANEVLASGKVGVEGTFSFNLRYNPRRARVALMRSAFLLMFRQFGYEYVLYASADVVRRQVLQYQEKIIPDVAVLRVPDDLKVVNVPMIATAPPELRCFFVPIKMASRSRTRVFGVALPGFDDEAAQLYDRMVARSKVSDRETMNFTAMKFHPRHLADPKRASLLSFWDETLGTAPRERDWGDHWTET